MVPVAGAVNPGIGGVARMARSAGLQRICNARAVIVVVGMPPMRETMVASVTVVGERLLHVKEL